MKKGKDGNWYSSGGVQITDPAQIAEVEGMLEAEPSAPHGETPYFAFKRLAKARVNKAIKQIQLIGNLSNRSSYEYTDEQVNKMFMALDQEIEAARLRFMPKDKDKPVFDFD